MIWTRCALGERMSGEREWRCIRGAFLETIVRAAEAGDPPIVCIIDESSEAERAMGRNWACLRMGTATDGDEGLE